MLYEADSAFHNAVMSTLSTCDGHKDRWGKHIMVKPFFDEPEFQIDASDVNDEQAVSYAEFVASCMQDMSQSWDDTLSSIMSFLTYGFSVHEIVYKRREGHEGESSSKFNDGLIGWRKLPIRGP